MEIIIKGTPDEVSTLIVAIQEHRGVSTVKIPTVGTAAQHITDALITGLQDSAKE